jgi:MinD superfamily P-loop ATPase
MVEQLIIGITGGKGGTGKTVLAVNLAVAMAGMGRKVTYIDCDADCPSAHILLGAELKDEKRVDSFLPSFDEKKCKKCGKCVETCQYNALYQVKGQLPILVSNLCSGCKACLLACPFGAIKEDRKTVGWTYRTEKHGIELFSGKLRPSEPLSEKMVEEIKERAFKEGNGEVFIVDTSAGAHCQVVRALEGCDKAAAVTEPTLFGIHDLGVITEVLEKMHIPHEVIVNRSTVSGRKIEGASMMIPYDRDMIDCYVEGIPIVEKLPEHEISKEIVGFAERLLE